MLYGASKNMDTVLRDMTANTGMFCFFPHRSPADALSEPPQWPWGEIHTKRIQINTP